MNLPKNISLAEFRCRLEPWLTQDPLIRPFVCDGSPLDCRVFLVGYNAAKRLSRPFIDYWSDDYGFLKSRFMADYLHERGLSAPKATRARIERFVSGLGHVKCLETNIHAKPTASKKELTRQDQQTDLFEFLMEAIRPEIVVPYSNAPIQFFERVTGRDDFVGQSVEVEWKGHHFELFGVRKHLCYVSLEEAENLGKRTSVALS